LKSSTARSGPERSDSHLAIIVHRDTQLPVEAELRDRLRGTYSHRLVPESYVDQWGEFTSPAGPASVAVWETSSIGVAWGTCWVGAELDTYLVEAASEMYSAVPVSEMYFAGMADFFAAG
jgi:hypothetical protein